MSLTGETPRGYIIVSTSVEININIVRGLLSQHGEVCRAWPGYGQGQELKMYAVMKNKDNAAKAKKAWMGLTWGSSPLRQAGWFLLTFWRNLQLL